MIISCIGNKDSFYLFFSFSFFPVLNPRIVLIIPERSTVNQECTYAIASLTPKSGAPLQSIITISFVYA